uniref:Membrane transport protein MMPL domain-containing protein n=1 Tax=Lotharella oceanica TaxID=641309 RepID=A0A7S2TPZ4_9EUKA|mmetsp:Transcript_21821/g.40876  ORF Transcript_21821/g.40876 Transcript_21821/m.40876 type:complete len:255 (+) Transcript_21821:867-1631(+)
MMGAAAILELTPDWNAVGANCAPWVREMRKVLGEKEAEGNSQGLGWKLYFEGMSPIISDLRDEMYDSAPYFMCLAVVIVVLFLTFMSFHSLTMGFRLLVTVAFSLSWVFGIMVVLLQDIRVAGAEGDGLHFIVPIVNVPVLIGLTLDYDLFLLVRIHEYRLQGFSTQDATMAAMYKTSGIITVAGLIMLTAFSALTTSDLFMLKTTGLLVVLTCLLDTFLVRAWLVPSLLMIGVEWNWWPGKVPPITKRCRVLD